MVRTSEALNHDIHIRDIRNVKVVFNLAFTLYLVILLLQKYIS